MGRNTSIESGGMAKSQNAFSGFTLRSPICPSTGDPTAPTHFTLNFPFCSPYTRPTTSSTFGCAWIPETLAPSWLTFTVEPFSEKIRPLASVPKIRIDTTTGFRGRGAYPWCQLFSGWLRMAIVRENRNFNQTYRGFKQRSKVVGSKRENHCKGLQKHGHVAVML